jgi:hypothetical protein
MIVRTPKEAMKQFCRECLGGRIEDNCGGNAPHIACPFYKYRNRLGNVPVRMHRKVCLDCMGGSYALVDDCKTETCPIWFYRFGKAPNRSNYIPSKNSLDALSKIHANGA